MGYVDEVLLDPDGTPRAFVVRGEHAILVSVSEIRRFRPAQERLIVRGQFEHES